MAKAMVQRLYAAADGRGGLSSPTFFLSDEEKAGVSLCELPVAIRSPKGSFEFLPLARSEMCAAEDIFFCGQLRPYAPSPSSRPCPDVLLAQDRKKRLLPHEETSPALLQRTDSFDWRQEGAAGRLWKGKTKGGGYSPGDQKLQPAKKPRWYLIAFGSISLPAEMDLRDMRSRLRRLRTKSRSGRCTGSAGAGDGGTWKLIRSMSCRGDVDGVVA